MKIQLTKKWKKLEHHKEKDKEKDKEINKESRKYDLQSVLVNDKEAYTEWIYEEAVELKDKDAHVQKRENSTEVRHAFLNVEFQHYACRQGGACLYINGHFLPVGAKMQMPVCLPVKLELKLKVLGNTSVKMDGMALCVYEKDKDLVGQLSSKADVLVVTPDYPSVNNLYLCAFVHSRVREYVAAGLNVQVASIADTWYQMSYELNGIHVLKGNYYDLKKILERKTVKAIVVHFVSEEYMQVFDGYVQDERLIFICHGPETLFEVLPNKVRPYFTKPVHENPYVYESKKRYVEKYAKKKNVTWVFVSQWLKDYSEKVLGIQFRCSEIIHNTINERLFPYYEKTADDRRRIMIIRKFDNISQHSIDQSVFAIRELSRRECFRELEFHIYGDGNYFDELLGPVREFSNVHIHRGFVPNDKISEIYRKNGILLIPSRHDAHAVSMGEAASCGMVVVGSRVTSNPYFMNEEENHTLADPEDPVELADIIERLYENPKEFLAISRRMSEETTKRCCMKQTVGKEISLIREKLSQADVYTDRQSVQLMEHIQPVLTIVVPAYNVSQYVDKCLYSLTNHALNHKLEILFINDGSTDQTQQKVQSFIQKYGRTNIVAVNKENGGHGSTINKGIELAKGKYFRLVDGDDWVDSENLARQIALLEETDADLMLTKGCYEYVERSRLENIIDYDALQEGKIYHFDDLTYPYYGFSDYGPLLTTSTYRTEALQKAGFKISEKKPYVDMEFNSYSLKYIDTVIYYDLDIYRYLIGREGQTISRDFWKKKYKDHEAIIFHICSYVTKEKELSARKKQYIAKRIIARMVDSQIFMFDQVTRWEEIHIFLEKLKQYETIYRISMRYVKNKNHDSSNILKLYSLAERKNRKVQAENRKPVVNHDSSINSSYLQRHVLLEKTKKAAKWVVPYEMAVRISKRKP